MRRIADQRDALRDERARQRKAERKGAARPGERDVAEFEPEALLEFGEKFSVRQRDQARGLARSPRSTRSRRGCPLSGSVANGPAGRKCSTARPAVIALMRDRGDDRGLRIRPRDARDAGALADARLRAVGRDQQARLKMLTVAELAPTPACDRASNAFRPKLASSTTPLGARASTSAAGEMRGSRPCGRTVRPASISPAKVRNVGRTASARRLSVIAMSRIGCASPATRVPHAERLEHAPRRCRDRGGARITPGARQRRVGDASP